MDNDDTSAIDIVAHTGAVGVINGEAALEFATRYPSLGRHAIKLDNIQGLIDYLGSTELSEFPTGTSSRGTDVYIKSEYFEVNPKYTSDVMVVPLNQWKDFIGHFLAMMIHIVVDIDSWKERAFDNDREIKARNV